MRCPKCGYISFDHLEVCAKCKKNIKAVSESLQGTVFQVQSPAFLQLQPRQMEDEAADEILVAQSGTEEEYVDDDLEILIEEPSENELGSDDRQPEMQLETGNTSAGDEEDREIEIDFSQFEDTPVESALGDEERPQGGGGERSFTLEMPEALADISDLAPPARRAEAEKEAPPAALGSSVERDQIEFDFNLGLDDLDLPPAPGSPKETELSLDDLDFSETIARTPLKAAGKTTADMDEELNFDLDLGGLSIHKDQ